MDTITDNFHIGIVKWYHDSVKQADYGFILNKEYNELFFHENNVISSEIDERDVVIFKVKSSQKHQDKFEAFDVRLVKSELNFSNLFSSLLQRINSEGFIDFSNKELSSVINRLLILTKDTNQNNITDNYLNEYISFLYNNYLNKNILKNDIRSIIEFNSIFPESNRNVINDILINSLQKNIIFDLWLEDITTIFPIEYIITILKSGEENLIYKLLNKSSEIERSELFNYAIKELGEINSKEKFNELKIFLDLINKFSPTYFDKYLNIAYENSTPLVRLFLWIDNYHNIFDFDSFKEYHNLLTDKDKRVFLKKTLEILNENITSFSSNELISLYINKSTKKDIVIHIIDEIKECAFKIQDVLINEILNIIPTFLRLELWIDNIHEVLDFHEYKLLTLGLNSDDQKKFLKKVFSYIHGKKVFLTIEDLLTINTIDYKISKELQDFDNTKIDYSISIILNLISELYNDNFRINSKSDSIRYCNLPLVRNI